MGERAEPIVHDCCGCSCHVCANGHDMSDGPKGHTEACIERFCVEQASRPEQLGPDTNT